MVVSRLQRYEVCEERAEVGVVTDKLMPLCRDLSGLRLRIQRVILAVEAVARNASGCTPRRILENGNVVRSDGDCMSLAKADLNGFCKEIDGF